MSEGGGAQGRSDRVPSLADFGIPEGRGGTGVSIGGSAGPRSIQGLELYAFDLPLTINRDVVVRLLAPDGAVVAERRATVGELGPEAPFVLAVDVPDTAPARYELVYEIHPPDGPPLVFAFDVDVPEQRLEVHMTCDRAGARPGDRVTLTVHNDGPSTAFFGVDYEVQRLDGHEWVAVPWDEERAWPMIGCRVGPGGTYDQVAEIPARARAGRHRFVKTIDMEHGSARAHVTAELDVA